MNEASIRNRWSTAPIHIHALKIAARIGDVCLRGCNQPVCPDADRSPISVPRAGVRPRLQAAEHVAPTIRASENFPDNGMRSGLRLIRSSRCGSPADVTSLRMTTMQEPKLLQWPATVAGQRTASARVGCTDQEDT